LAATDFGRLAGGGLSAISLRTISRDAGQGRGPAAGGARGCDVERLLQASRVIDAVNDKFGVIANYLVLVSCVVSAGNAMSRHFLSESSNAWLEVQWYMFAAMVLFGAPYTLKVNEHVRVDLIYSAVSERGRIWIDILGGVLFLLPICVILVYFTWPFFVDSWRIQEGSSNAGGLIRWPVKLLLPVGFTLMALQGVSEIIKRIAALNASYRLQYGYEKPMQ
jgi:TRAP-type mannitol/chloroaromatic compound transport system permease small subunit